jgi:hypothetical protein
MQPHVVLFVPAHTVTSRGRIVVRRPSSGVFSVAISVPWRRRIRIVTRSHGRRRSQLIGGILFAPPRPSSRSARARSAFFLDPRGSVCFKLAVSVGTGLIESGPFDLEIDGAAVVSCLVSEGIKTVSRAVASKIASTLGHDCAAALLKSTRNDVTFFDIPQCNEPKGPSGPSDGTPLVVATLTPPAINGIPIGGSAPPNPPAPAPSPPSGPSLAAHQFGVMNAAGGIYWRSAPDWNTPESSPGNGFYPDTIINVICYQAGAANVPGSSDGMWEQASWAAGSGSGSGWVNEHFVNDGAAINQPSPGTPPCASSPPPPPSYLETTGGVTHTWTNYTNAGGYEGPAIPSNTTVQIACKLTGFRVADGNTWWYRIASAPWSGAYYASADAFYNNGQTSGSLKGTPFVDSAVPGC